MIQVTGFQAKPGLSCARVQQKRISPKQYQRSQKIVQSSRQICVFAEEKEGQQPVPDATKVTTWHAVVANAEFMLHDVQNEAMAEQLREKARFYEENKYPLDFFIVSEPKWLESRCPKDAPKVGRPCVALVSPDKVWITFMKLRLDRVLQVELKDMGVEEVTAQGAPVPKFEQFESSQWTAPYSPYTLGWWDRFLPENNLGKKAEEEEEATKS